MRFWKGSFLLLQRNSLQLFCKSSLRVRLNPQPTNFVLLQFDFRQFGCPCAVKLCVEVRVRRSTSVAERRQWDRLPLAIPFFVRGRKGSGEEFLEFATALNLSAGGVLLATRRYLDPGTEISLEVPISLVNKAQLPRSVSLLHATVLRCTADRQYFLLGLQFREPLLNHQTGLEFGKLKMQGK